VIAIMAAAEARCYCCRVPLAEIL